MSAHHWHFPFSNEKQKTLKIFVKAFRSNQTAIRDLINSSLIWFEFVWYRDENIVEKKEKKRCSCSFRSRWKHIINEWNRKNIIVKCGYAIRLNECVLGIEPVPLTQNVYISPHAYLYYLYLVRRMIKRGFIKNSVENTKQKSSFLFSNWLLLDFCAASRISSW